MGISFSQSSLGNRCSPRSQSEPSLDSSVLQQPLHIVTKIVSTYLNHGYPPMLDVGSLRNLIIVAISGDKQVDVDMLVDVLWLIFEHEKNQICYIQEILTMLVLLCKPSSVLIFIISTYSTLLIYSIHQSTWNNRLALIFDIFKTMGTEVMYHEDIMMAVQVASSAISKLWNLDQTFDFDELTRLSEAIADHAFNKLSRDIEEGVSKEMFLSWGTDRFKETVLVADFSTLAELYEMPY